MGKLSGDGDSSTSGSSGTIECVDTSDPIFFLVASTRDTDNRVSVLNYNGYYSWCVYCGPSIL